MKDFGPKLQVPSAIRQTQSPLFPATHHYFKDRTGCLVPYARPSVTISYLHRSPAVVLLIARSWRSQYHLTQLCHSQTVANAADLISTFTTFITTPITLQAHPPISRCPFLDTVRLPRKVWGTVSPLAHCCRSFLPHRTPHPAGVRLPALDLSATPPMLHSLTSH